MPAKTLLLLTLPLCLLACRTIDPIMATPSFTATPELAQRNPADIAVLPVEDGTRDKTATRHADVMRQALMEGLIDQMYSPLSAAAVDAALSEHPLPVGSTIVAPAVLRSASGHCNEDATLAVRIERWDESGLLRDSRTRFQAQAVLGAPDGTILWSGTVTGEVKAGGHGPAPRDPDTRARSCAMLAMEALIGYLPRRNP